MNFISDNSVGVAPEIMSALSEANRGRPCHDWALAMYERHRAPAPAVVAANA